ncbi:MAG: methyltransferase domain-containing protein, partial [Phycisphaerales bacterium]|nr:methyltransferase domain-containing protein [Phycisphaerales bacterium]
MKSIVLTALLLLILGSATLTLAAEPSQGAEILDACGVRGGLVVHLGCGDGKLTIALRVNDSCLVHGLDIDAKNIAKAREHIRSKGFYGAVSVEMFDGKRLPYADNMVNLLVADKLGGMTMDEVMRVLTPLGVAQIGRKKIVKPRPKELDEWTHYLHNASGNPVARDDAVKPPRQLKWVASPKWGRHHEHM